MGVEGARLVDQPATSRQAYENAYDFRQACVNALDFRRFGAAAEASSVGNMIE